MQEKRYQVFVSSTFNDLIDVRQAAVEAILETGNIPAGMEQFTASNIAQWNLIKNWIEKSDIYMLIVGGRYGSKHSRSHRSYTEMEYRYAKKIKKPMFALLASDSFIEKQIKDGIIDDRSDDYIQTIRFRSKIQNKIVNFFNNRDQVKLYAVRSLSKTIDEMNGYGGWVRNSEEKEIDIGLIFPRHWMVGQGCLPDVEEKHNYLAIQKMVVDKSISTIRIGSPHLTYWTQPAAESRLEWLLKNTNALNIEIVLFMPARKTSEKYLDSRCASAKICKMLSNNYSARLKFIDSLRCTDISYIIYPFFSLTNINTRALIGLQTSSYQSRPFFEHVYSDKDIPPLVNAALEIHMEGMNG